MPASVISLHDRNFKHVRCTHLREIAMRALSLMLVDRRSDLSASLVTEWKRVNRVGINVERSEWAVRERR